MLLPNRIHRHAESLRMTDMMAETTSWPLLCASKAEINSEIAKTESGPEWLRRLEHGNWLCACSTARVSLQVNAPCWQKEVSSRKVQESHSTYSTANFNANTHTHTHADNCKVTMLETSQNFDPRDRAASC